MPTIHKSHNFFKAKWVIFLIFWTNESGMEDIDIAMASDISI